MSGPAVDEHGVLAGALDRDFVRVAASPIAGTGAFARRAIHEGARIIEYMGARVPAAAMPALSPAGVPASVYAFRLDAETVIDGTRGGNDARFINHSCAPNCEAMAFGGRMYIYALRDIAEGEELTFDYQLAPVGDLAPGVQDVHAHPCRCGASSCRGTMRSQAAVDVAGPGN